MSVICPAELARIGFWNEFEFDTSGVEETHAEYAQEIITGLLAHISATDPKFANGPVLCTCETGDGEHGPFIMAAHSIECALLQPRPDKVPQEK